jgi:gamma-glutamyltranspeptidase/glutathione hydrolase
VVTLLVSIFHEFGSGCVVPEWGFFLNNRLLGMDHVAMAPGARPLHTLSPAMLRTPDMVVGLATPGADAQVQVLAQVLDPVLHNSLTWDHALTRPRWRLVDQTVLVEASMDPEVTAELSRLGHDIRLCDPGDPAFGAVTAAGIRDHTCWAAVDGRRFTSALASADRAP